MTFLGFAVLFILVMVLWNRLNEAESQIKDLADHIKDLTDRLRGLDAAHRREKPQEAPAPPLAEPAPSVTPAFRTPAATPPPPPLPVATPKMTPPSIPIPQATKDKLPEPVSAWTPPKPADSPRPKIEHPPLVPQVSLEAFMGVKLFAWLGGLALFLGVIFFVRYSFEHNLITPPMRIGLGALTGLGLIAGGLFVPRPKFTVTAHTLCATGVVILYGVTYATCAVYHFIGLDTAFAVMVTITVVAFLLAVRLNAQVIAILGLLGGFLSPWLFPTALHNPTGLFTYLAVLDVGIIAIALRRRWEYIITLGAAATVFVQMLWLATDFAPAKLGMGATIFLGFEALFLIPFWLNHREQDIDEWTFGASAVSTAAALLFSSFILQFPEIGQHPWICLSILFSADAGAVVWALRRPALQGWTLLAGGMTFLILSAWNFRYLNNDLLNWALGYFLVFAAFHTAIPVIVRRLHPEGPKVPSWVQVFPALSLLLMLWPAFHIGASATLWIAVLISDLAALVLAAVTASLLGVVAALLITLAAATLWLFQTPVEDPASAGLLTIIAGFAALFCGASVFLQNSLRTRLADSPPDGLNRQALDQLPNLSVLLPFGLLISTVVRLHPANPSAIFGVSLLLVIIIFALARWSRSPFLPLIGLICGTMVEYCWRSELTFEPQGWLPLGWYLAFAGAAFIFPFLCESRQSGRVVPWATAALAPVLHYPLVHDIVRSTWPQFWHSAAGLVPAALAVPPLAASFYLKQRLPQENPARLGILAWFGGVALLFITLIFPTQFRHEWLTLSWAFEGAALLWLFRRLPHPGLRGTGFALLCIAFVRLSLNPAVLSYHERSATPILNWYLYTYALASACFFIAARLSAPAAGQQNGGSLQATLNSLGTILLFLLMNIEIADYFSTAATLTFDFEGNLKRDMTYSIAWSFFALTLLLIGMHRQVAPIRYAGIGLLVVTLLKLFFHDLASLDQLYRIVAFIVVAIVLISASYFYQRFLSVEDAKRPAP